MTPPAADGRTLYIASLSALPRPVFRLDPESGKRERFRDLLRADPTGVSQIDVVAIVPDGRAYAYSYVRRSCDLYVFDGLK